MTFKAVSIAAFLLASAAASAQAGVTELVQNGNFELTTHGGGQLGYNTNATDWTSSAPPGSYNFLFPSGTADTTGVTGQYGNLQLWGPNNGSSNGLPASSPDGGNFVALDGAFDSGPLSQTINHLIPGKTYALSFEWAGAQQYTFTGPNTEQLQVSFGSETQSTSVYSNPSHGFSGWKSQTFDFTASSSSEVLSFLAIGTPISPSVPPFSLLDGVSLIGPSAAPEPSSWAMLMLGFAGLGFAGYRQSRRAPAPALRGQPT